MRKKFLLAFLLCIGTFCSIPAQSTSQWCLKTDQGQYIEMARVEMLAAVDGQPTFEVIVREGQGAVGVKSITFEIHESDYVAPKDDEPIVITETGPWCLITDKGDSVAMSRVQMLANVDGACQFEVVTSDGANLVGVSNVYFGRGKSNTSGGFVPIDGSDGQPDDSNKFNPWCMITDKNDSIAMSRVQMIANVDGNNKFEIVTMDGADVSDVSFVRFAHGNTKTSGGFVPYKPGEEPKPVGDGPWCLITDKNDSIAMSRVQFLANIDQDDLFEVVTRDGEGAVSVKSVRFARGLSDDSGGFVPYQEGGEEPEVLTGEFYMVTNNGEEQPMSNVAMLANVDDNGTFEVLLNDGGSMPGVKSVTFKRKSEETGIEAPAVKQEEMMLTLHTPVHFELKLSGCGTAKSAIVYSLKGVKMAEAPVSNGTATISVGHLLGGIYIVRVGNKALKFVKQ